MQNPNRNKLLVAGAVAFVALAVALGWLWGAKKTRDLESSARGSIVATTALLREALALKGRTERYYFEYRTAMGAFADLLKAHRDTQDKVRAALPAAPLLEAAVVDGAYQRARQAEEQAAAELERIRQMVVPR